MSKSSFRPSSRLHAEARFRVEAVIFDMDGLMLDTERLFIPIWIKAGESFGYNISTEIILRTVGIRTESTRAVMLEEFGDDFPFDNIRDKVRILFNEEIEKNGVSHKKGLIFLLDRLTAANIPLAVATSSSKNTAQRMLSAAGIIDRFKVVVAGDDVANGKPAPDIFLLAAEKIGVHPSSCVGFEDSTAGLMSLQAAGIRSVFIKDIIQPPPEVLAAVWHTCEDLEQAVKLLEV